MKLEELLAYWDSYRETVRTNNSIIDAHYLKLFIKLGFENRNHPNYQEKDKATFVGFMDWILETYQIATEGDE